MSPVHGRRGGTRHPEHHAAIVQWTMVIVMTRRLARYHKTDRLKAALSTG
jgi:hypothetical protein